MKSPITLRFALRMKVIMPVKFLLPVIFFCLFVPSVDAQDSSAMLDLQQWKFTSANSFPLDGKWEFYWNKLLGPGDFKQSATIHPDTLVVPSSWGEMKLKGKAIGNIGFATYRIVLKNLPSTQLVMEVYSVQTSCRIFIDDRLVAEVGKVGTTKESTQPMNRDVQVLLPSDKNEVQLIVQIANFHHRKGGFAHPFRIGLPEAINGQRATYYMLDFTESSALAIIGLFLFAMYIFRRKDLSVLYFSLFCITLSLRPVISVNYLLASIFPNISWDFLLRLEYLSVLFPCLFMLLFLKKLFTAQFPGFFVKLLGAVLVIMIAIVFFFSPLVFSWLVLPLLIIIPFGILIFTITIIRAILAKVEGANYAGLGTIILFISLILKVLSYAGQIPEMNVLSTVIDIAFIFTMSLVLGSRFSLQFVKVETLQRQSELQRQEIEVKKVQVEKQKAIVEEKNKEILDSITYAKRIQHSILPPLKLIRQFFPESFVFYKPKDIIAGDFYWMESQGDLVFIAAADCTGHGVPGALVSVVCCNALNRAVKEFGISDPGKILDKARTLVVETFEKSENDVKDGMDISLCCIRLNGNSFSVKWAGANNPLVYFQSGERREILADRQSIGKTDHAKPFTTHALELGKGDSIYLFTDGYADQFGGPNGKKFRAKQLLEGLTSIQQQSMDEQEKALDRTLENWKNWPSADGSKMETEQVDDISVIGIRL